VRSGVEVSGQLADLWLGREVARFVLLFRIYINTAYCPTPCLSRYCKFLFRIYSRTNRWVIQRGNVTMEVIRQCCEMGQVDLIWRYNLNVVHSCM
jgi:hypothetical protein